MSREAHFTVIPLNSKLSKKSKKASISSSTPIRTAEPRPGGYLKATDSIIKLKQSISNQSRFTHTMSRSHLSTSESFYSVSREHRINTVLNEISSDLSTKSIINISEDEDNNKLLVDSVLAVTISCVMLMASNFSKISEECLEWTENYLSCIKDGQDNYPPNIKGILNHIRYLRSKFRKPKSQNVSSTCTCADYIDNRNRQPVNCNSISNTTRSAPEKQPSDQKKLFIS